jgi:hypothetical protein
LAFAPSLLWSMPSTSFEKMRFPRTVFLVPPPMTTPPVLKAMRLPAPLASPPTVLPVAPVR